MLLCCGAKRRHFVAALGLQCNTVERDACVRVCVSIWFYACVCVGDGANIDFPTVWKRRGWKKKSSPFFIALRVFIYPDTNIKLKVVNRGIVDIESVCPLSCSAISGMPTETANLTYYIRWGIRAYHGFCESHRAGHWEKHRSLGQLQIFPFLTISRFT